GSSLSLREFESQAGGSSVSRNAASARFARASGIAICSASALLAYSSQGFAAQIDDEAVDELAEVTVTGTRIQAPNMTASNPVTSIDGEEMRRLGIVNVADALTQLVPQNISSYMPTMVGD